MLRWVLPRAAGPVGLLLSCPAPPGSIQASKQPLGAFRAGRKPPTHTHPLLEHEEEAERGAGDVWGGSSSGVLGVPKQPGAL